jgi:hypothetical protein
MSLFFKRIERFTEPKASFFDWKIFTHLFETFLRVNALFPCRRSNSEDDSNVTIKPYDPVAFEDEINIHSSDSGGGLNHGVQKVCERRLFNPQ